MNVIQNGKFAGGCTNRSNGKSMLYKAYRWRLKFDIENIYDIIGRRENYVNPNDDDELR